MAPWAETCCDIVRPINSVMHSEMWASCCVWQEKQNSCIVLGSSWVSAQLAASQVGLSSMRVISNYSPSESSSCLFLMTRKYVSLSFLRSTRIWKKKSYIRANTAHIIFILRFADGYLKSFSYFMLDSPAIHSTVSFCSKTKLRGF
jgi:hypothetical protein